MSYNLKQIDKSKNMEDLRAARSYNDLVFVISRIKAATSSIHTRLARNLIKSNTESVEIRMTDDNGFLKDKKMFTQPQADLNNIISFSFELQFARSLSGIVSSDVKLNKFRTICESMDRELVQAQNLAYKYLDQIATKIEPTQLPKYTKIVEKLLSSTLAFYKQNSFVIPDARDKISFVRYLVLHNVRTPNEYVLPNFIVALHANNNLDNTFSFAVSFPHRVGDDSRKLLFSDNNSLLAFVRDAIANSFGVKDIGELGEAPRRYIETMENVLSTYVHKGALFIELESGVTGSDINSLLTRLLKVAHVALGVQDTKSDIIHSVTVGSKGNKIVKLALSNRNFYDNGAISALRNMLAIDPKTYKAIRAITMD